MITFEHEIYKVGNKTYIDFFLNNEYIWYTVTYTNNDNDNNKYILILHMNKINTNYNNLPNLINYIISEIGKLIKKLNAKPLIILKYTIIC